MFHRWLKICVYVRAFACLVEGACVHLLCCSVRKADNHKFVVSNICLHISVCASALCYFWDGKRKGFGRPVERSLNPPPLLALVLFSWKCDCNLRTVFRFRFTTSSGFPEQKRGLKTRVSIGPHQAVFFWEPLNWCQNLSGASPKCFWGEKEEEEGITDK